LLKIKFYSLYLHERCSRRYTYSKCALSCLEIHQLRCESLPYVLFTALKSLKNVIIRVIYSRKGSKPVLIIQSCARDIQETCACGELKGVISMRILPKYFTKCINSSSLKRDNQRAISINDIRELLARLQDEGSKFSYQGTG
jgi:hypothetical protein